MSTIERVSPDALSMPDGEAVNVSAAALSPCPNCGVDQKDAPEGTDASGNAVWQAEHCHKCGFRPGHNVANKMHEMRAAFAAFLEQHNGHIEELTATPAGARSLLPPVDAEKEALKAQLADLQAQMAADKRATSTADTAASDAAPAVS